MKPPLAELIEGDLKAMRHTPNICRICQKIIPFKSEKKQYNIKCPPP